MITSGMMTSNSEEWATPQKVFDELNNEFKFTLDPCSTHENAKCKKHYTKNDNGLVQSWENEVVFCNPPYGRVIKYWIEKCYNEHKNNGTTVVALLPARTDTTWFHKYIYNKSEIRFIKGRLHFNDSKNSAPFPSMVVIWK